jgi:methyl-accepting chemotaxis protein
MKRMQDQLTETIRTITTSAESIASATGQIAAGNQDLSQRTEEQAAALQETAATMEKLTSTVNQNVDNTRQASQVAAQAVKVAQRGSGVISQVIDTTNGIQASSDKIANIVGMIESVAFQTNILALNAAVEAARAGEQGRGFAVAASEVRSLAHRSSSASKEIKGLIQDSVERVRAGAEFVNAAGVTMDEITQSVQRVTDILGEIAAASIEQSNGIGQVSKGCHADGLGDTAERGARRAGRRGRELARSASRRFALVGGGLPAAVGGVQAIGRPGTETMLLSLARDTESSFFERSTHSDQTALAVP